MYQFYYADHGSAKRPVYQQQLNKVFDVTAVRPTMWEEHCLECSAPLCFENCVHYEARSDGRCKRFVNGIEVFEDERGCCGQAARVKFRKWANMMTIIYPSMLPLDDYKQLTAKNQKLGSQLEKIAKSKLPLKARWETIRTREFLRRRNLRKLSGMENTPDAFVFHGYSFEDKPFHLIVEVFDDHTSAFKTSLLLEPGENLHIVDEDRLSKACSTPDFLVKIYPENDIEAEIEFLWCDFVKGKRVQSAAPAKNVKCVVWDLDNTLWNGTLIETENPDALQLKPCVLNLIKALDERGIVQSIASKNDYEPAWKQIKRLGLADYFLYPQIHWNAKSGSIAQIAKSLNIGSDTFALIDDSVFEREQVRSAMPQVRVYDAAEIPQLLDKPEFTVMVTEESKSRRAMYKAEEKRHQLMQIDKSDTIEFLKKCHLRIHIFEPKTEAEKLRCYELVVRTNQLNMSGKKYTAEEFEAVLAKPEHTNFVFDCEDDFGKYGIVGFGQYKVENDVLVFTEFAMSCRVAGKYVESALFSKLIETSNCKLGRFSVKKTEKNILLRRTLSEIGFIVEREDFHSVNYIFYNELKEQDLVKVLRRNAEHG